MSIGDQAPISSAAFTHAIWLLDAVGVAVAGIGWQPGIERMASAWINGLTRIGDEPR